MFIFVYDGYSSIKAQLPKENICKKVFTSTSNGDLHSLYGKFALLTWIHSSRIKLIVLNLRFC